MYDVSLGRKVFFLYPHSVIKEELIDVIVRNEYEVYLVKDHAKLRQKLKKHPGSIVFINIDDVQSEQDWVKYAKNIIDDTSLDDIRIGILTYNENAELAKTFLMEVGVQCGFIRLKLGAKQSIDIILKTLAANEAKGKRKYVRADCRKSDSAAYNVNVANSLETGLVRDISVVGMACTFEKDVELQKNMLLKDLQLKLKGSVSMVTGLVMGSREIDGVREYIVMFVKPAPQTKERIHKFIQAILQYNMNKELGV